MHEIWRQRRLRISVGVGLLVLLAAFFASGAGAVGGANREDVGACKRSTLTSPPLWTGSGVWNGEDLVLVDTVRRSLLPYSPTGRTMMEPRGSLQKALRDLYPIRLAASVGASREQVGGDRLAMQVDADRFLVMDRGYATLRNVNARQLPARDGSGAAIDKIFDWTLAGSDIVGFADVKAPGDRWFSGPVRFSMDAPNDFQVLNNLATDDTSRLYHKLANPYTASLGDTAYYLLMGNGIHLWKHAKGGEPVDLGDLEATFPAWTASSHSLPSFVNPQDASGLMQAVERSSMPTGLYAWVDPESNQKALYLASRQWQEAKTDWLLTKLDPKDGHVLGTTRIGSKANHLFFVPGADQWAVVEKGPLLGLREQEVKSIYTIPAAKVVKAFQHPKRTEVLDICQ